MSYWAAVKAALFADWFEFVRDDVVCGNGFDITGYGLWLLLQYLGWFLLRLLIAVSFPVSALLLMRARKCNQRYQREVDERLDDLV